VTEISPWTNALHVGTLPDSVVHVWAWQNHTPGESCQPDLSHLSEQEIHRCLRFRFPRDQISFATSHRNMRFILASYLGATPERLIITPAEGGKPHLEGAGERLHFNLSHCKDVGMLAVAWNIEVGVDVEQPRRLDPSVAERFFSPAELSQLSTLNGDAWRDGFLRCWTRKEALLKAEGLGLRIPLDSFDVCLAVDDPRLLAVRPPAKISRDWQLYDVSPSTAYIACLAASSAPAAIHRFNFSPQHESKPATTPAS
jgi:4'-phosphopantetheinyl transferase